MFRKTILSLILSLSIFGCAHSQEGIISITEFGGWVDKVPADKLGDKFSPDLLNVWVNEYMNTVTKRKGYIDYFNSALTQQQKIRKLYTYKQVDGDEYMIIVSSWSIYYSKGDGNTTSIKDNLDSSFRWDFATGKNTLFCHSNSTQPFKWDGTTATWLNITNSTGMVHGNLCVYWNNRLFIAGVDGQESTLYYSEVNDPQNIQPLNYIYVNVSDGQKIKGLYIWQNKLLVFKEYSTWEVVEVSAGNFTLRRLSGEIGCLYDSSIAEYNGFPIFVSHRGVELYDGAFTLVSETIDNFMKGLTQLNTEQSEWIQTTAADFGASGVVGVNIDTTTYGGSVAISSNTIYWDQTTATDWGAGSGTNIDTTTISGSVVQAASTSVLINSGTITTTTNIYAGLIARQSFWSGTSINGIQFTLTLGDDVLASGSQATFARDFTVALSSVSTNVLASSVTSTANLSVSPDSGTDINFIFPSVTLEANTTYYITISTNTDADWNDFVLRWLYRSTNNFTQGKAQTTTNNVTWTDQSYDFNFGTMYTMHNNASYTSQSKEAANWKAWSTFTADEALDGETINYLAVTSTSSYNLTTNAQFTLTDGADINSTVGPFIKIISSFTRTSYSTNPKLNSFTVIWDEQGSFTSQQKEATSWGSWGTFTVDDTVPSGSSMEYRAVTSTSSHNLTTNASFALTDNGAINSTVGPFIKVISSFTRTDATAIPKVNEFSVTWYGTTDNDPVGIIYKDNYWLGLSTDTETNVNNVVIVLDKDGNWLLWNDIYMGAACLYRNKLYIGESNNTGMIHRHDIGYNDDGRSYDSYWRSKIFGSTIEESTFNEIWVRADNSGSWNLNVDYRLDGSTETYTTKTLALNNGYGLIASKLNLNAPRSYFIQLGIGNNNANEYFQVKEIHCIFNRERRR